MDILPAEIAQLREVIDQFLRDRLQPKLDKLKDADDERREELIRAHQPEHWIADAARRVAQIQQVSHALKYAHPDAQGTSLYSEGNASVGETLIGTHTLAGSGATDVVGNAAALDTYKFLKLAVNGRTLLQRARDGDAALEQALSDNAQESRRWMGAFAVLAEAKGQFSSHKLAKQIYWPLAGGEYHLLAPLFPTTLVQRVWQCIWDDRFSDGAKAAREASRAGQQLEHGYAEYPELLIQKFGGTKPQNISQLNSERHGEVYLLASIPPNWSSEPIALPLGQDSIFGPWLNRRPQIYRPAGELRDYLVSVRLPNNIDVRDRRAELVARIMDEVLQLAAHLQRRPAGWTTHENCRLNTEECCWLDPQRGKQDPDFAEVRRQAAWIDAVCHRFGNWLNARIGTRQTPMGEDEHREWKDLLAKEINLLREELDEHE